MAARARAAPAAAPAARGCRGAARRGAAGRPAVARAAARGEGKGGEGVPEVTIVFRGRGWDTPPQIVPARADGTPIAGVEPTPMSEAWWLASRGHYAVTMPMEGIKEARFVLSDGAVRETYGASGGGALRVGRAAAVVAVAEGGVHAAHEGAPLLLVSDLDGTMVGNDAAGAEFSAFWRRRHAAAGSVLCYSTGRSLAQFEALREELPRGALLAPDALVTGVGTRVYAPDGFTGGFAEDEDWAQRLRVSWDGAHAADALDAVLGGSRGGVADEVRPLGADDQGEYKRSLLARADVAAEVAEELLAALEERGSKGKVVASGDGEYVYVDLLPREAGKRTAMEYVRDAFAVDPARVVACGDSANDVDMLAGAHNAVCVGNAQPALMEWAKTEAAARGDAEDSPRLLVTDAAMAAGILEALDTLGLA